MRLVSPYGAGGASDISLRILAEQFGRSLNQQFIVENKPGAGTRVANELVSRAAPDGYTFLYAAAPFATAEALFEKLNYNRKDLQPVAMAMMAPLFLVVNAQAPFKTLQEMIDYGRSKPEGLTFGSSGRRLAAASGRRAAVQGRRRQGPHRSLPRRQHGLHGIAGEPPRRHVDRAQHGLAAHPERSVALCWVWRRPSAAAIYPEAMTLREQGLSKVVASGWYGFMAPAATPQRDRRSAAGGGYSRACRSRGEAEAASPGDWMHAPARPPSSASSSTMRRANGAS